MLACVSGQLPAEHADDVKDTEYQPPKSVHPIGRNVVPLNLTLFSVFLGAENQSPAFAPAKHFSLACSLSSSLQINNWLRD